ncbi:carboxymuconolactone decarboxylase family protein [Gordonia sp. TBRC 11910]|uniref:Carboxymuconolactone decarboxylase family protein n=1 Tax=Gordonia asplenii TaxID=2725283 RepID=A0A848L206_9ACTN|nr:carboxymuconolactone decarboxylase family protein [Gordonia asplenii]NMO04759.1 carboxymuconolactone decarboxylase family protein [Gordonia asplenii]
MRAAHRIRAYVTVFAQAKRNRVDLYGWLIRRPLILVMTGFYEFALMFSNRMDPRLKELAELKTAGLINCEFCLDIGSALARTAGISERQIRDLPVYADSDAYDDIEKLVISFAEALTVTPAVDIEPIRSELLVHFSKGQVAELAAAVAWENQRARLNQGLGVRPTGMSDGAACALPEPRRA